MKVIPETRHVYLIRCIHFYYSGKNFISDMMKTPDTRVEKTENEENEVPSKPNNLKVIGMKKMRYAQSQII
jgi:hypothetical protein